MVVVAVRPDDGRVAADRDAVAEVVARRAVGGGELGDLGPARAGVLEDVGRAGIAAVVIVAVRPDDGRVAADRDAVAEVVARRAVGGGELGDLRPARAGVLEDVGRAGIAAVVVVAVRPDDGRVAADRDAVAEVVAGRAVGGGELGDLDPARAGVLEDVGRAGVAAAVIVPVRPDDGRVAADRDAVAEVVARRAVGWP